MSEQKRGHVRRPTERDARENCGPPLSGKVKRQRIRARGVQEHRHEHVKISGRDYRQSAKRGGRDVALECCMRMADEVDPKGTEQISRLKELELRRTQRLSHPPQVPEKVVVVAARTGM